MGELYGSISPQDRRGSRGSSLETHHPPSSGTEDREKPRAIQPRPTRSPILAYQGRELYDARFRVIQPIVPCRLSRARPVVLPVDLATGSRLFL